MKNLHQYYHKDYFKDIDFNYLLLEEKIEKEQNKHKKEVLKEQLKRIKNDNESKIKVRNNKLCNTPPSTIYSVVTEQAYSISLKIAYPGLVTGIGINHEAKIEGEFKLGVHFDYTWGMPVVYGSSVKGVLRAYFEDFYQEDQAKPRSKDLFDDIFEGRDVAKEHQLKDNKKYYKSIYNRDIFFDAVIVRADKKGRILCSDSITPHGDNPLKNPTPLTFLKIAPGCSMEFRFKLVDSEIDGKKFTADQKKALFEEIIKTIGIGAKTNVGYGQFQ